MATEHTYWQRYGGVFKYFSFKSIFHKICETAKAIGQPFTKKSKRGRKFKINPCEYIFDILKSMKEAISLFVD